MLGRTALICFLLLLGRTPADGQSPEQWRIEAVPRVSIGAVEGSDSEILVNALFATRLEDGRIVVRNSTRGLFELRYYSSSGVHLRTASRWGQGPYEFHSPLSVQRLEGDSILVLGEDDRYAVFDPRGGRGSEGRVGLLAHLPAILGGPVDDRHVAILKRVSGPGGMPPPGTQRSEGRLLVVDRTTGSIRSEFPVTDRTTHYETAERGVYIYAAPFARETFFSGGAGLLWIADSESPEVRGYRPGVETPVVTIRVPFEQRRVTRRDRAMVRDRYSSRGSGDGQKRWARYARSMDVPDLMPWFGGLEVDRSGNVWVQEYEPFWSGGAQTWAVFSPAGRRLATAEVPAAALPLCARRIGISCGLQTGIFEIGDDYMLVPQRDDLDVRYVRAYGIRKPS